jgi:chromosome segregation ATPase
MILEEVELHQVCQHEHFVHKFHPGLTGIFGPNGAGKSNFVKMTWASLTGECALG